ncbi:MAG: acyloxyacyl hydrolase [Terracidiphilus sp.]
MTRTAAILLCVSIAATTLVSAQTSKSADVDADNPVAHVRDAHSWEFGPFLNYGTGVGDRSDYKFFWGGFQLGKPMFPVMHAGILSGQFELSGNVIPFWVAFTPPPHEQTFFYPGPGCPTGGCSFVAPEGGGAYPGVSITPVIFRWNFLTNSRRFQPWFQGAGGVIYTNHKFPPDQLVPKGTPGGTSVWNFSPQGGFGVHYFIHPRRSIDLGVNALHISSASLGDKNPGVNASIQIQVGYTYWK